MKHFALMLSSLIVALPITGSAGDWMIGGNLSSARGDTSASALDRQLEDEGLNATATSEDDSRWAGQLFARYRYNDTWATEIGYVDLGNISTTLEGTSADIEQFLNQAEDIHPQTATGFQVSGLYRYPLEINTSLMIQGGIFDWNADYKLSTDNAERKVKADGVSGWIGLAMEHKLNPKNAITLNLQRFTVDGEAVQLLGMGWIYQLQ